MPKKLYKTEQDKVFCGVCGGIGEYLNLDPNVVRLLAVLIAVFCLFLCQIFSKSCKISIKKLT